MVATADISLPRIKDAPLPQMYEQARTALEKCSSVDECKEWANRSEALASYARQSKDDALRKMCDRIQARAIRRCGELLRQMDGRGGDRKSAVIFKCKCGETFDKQVWHCDACAHHWLMDVPECRNCHEGLRRKSDAAARIKSNGNGTFDKSQNEAAQEAGMSKRQKDTAVRVAAVPQDEFERQVESPNPPSVTKLAEQGKKTRPVEMPNGCDKAEFVAATTAMGEVSEFLAFCRTVDWATVKRGMRPREINDVRRNLQAIANSIAMFLEIV